MGNMLENPKTDKDSEHFLSHTKLRGGLSGMQGYRTEMEDTHILTDMPSCKDVTIAAIFDGHGGKSTAEYAASNLIHVIEDTATWKSYLHSKSTDDLSAALTEAFLKIDDMLQSDQIIRDSMAHCGCTSVVALITKTHIVCANAGDSRCVLGVDESSLNLSEDHKPVLDVERNRIKNAGGEYPLY
jgi:serine/threonine protein phosphatase PrpC